MPETNDIFICNKSSISSQIPEDGFIVLIDKEPDWTSFDVVAKLRGILKIKKIGHAGTLDPFATGLLLILVGKATKRQNGLMAADKVYEAEIKLGEKTDSYDRTGKVTATSDLKVSAEQIREVVMSFVGENLQIPPMFSAIKKDGKRLYELARKGIEIEREPRKVTIHSIDISAIETDIIRVRVHCSKGTYIRSLANDIGERLGTYGHLKDLRRTSIGNFSVKDALKVSEFAEEFNRIN
ncbi:MAG: tRNA pseudouridine(55) synthase TruB [Candidatus Delongbacteria bacterium]|nr:tRNA pseudouridine(55) synthase TruB [Candidatus Delongbacteria bacterium]MCG2759961.1 tRNA pseudouridine(55) synthase TruB [Candidatus Delongbacteria bacterium]